MTPHRSAAPGRRRGAQLAAVLATVVGVRQLVDLVLHATVPMWSAGATMLVETLAVTGLYGALAWFFVVVPARRRSAPPASAHGHPLQPAMVRQQSGPALHTVPATQARHLTLVRDSNRR